MNLFLAIAITLLTILAILHYLLKVKKENSGKLFLWSGYLLLIAAGVLLACLAFKGAKKMIHKKNNREHMMMRKHMKGDRMMMDCAAGMGDCSQMEKMNCDHSMMKGHGCCMENDSMEKEGRHMRSKSTVDTVDGKIVRKEIIIK